QAADDGGGEPPGHQAVDNGDGGGGGLVEGVARELTVDFGDLRAVDVDPDGLDRDDREVRDVHDHPEAVDDEELHGKPLHSDPGFLAPIPGTGERIFTRDCRALLAPQDLVEVQPGLPAL